MTVCLTTVHFVSCSAAVWSMDLRVVIPLALLTLGHWALTIAGKHHLSVHANSRTDILYIPAIVPSIELSPLSNIAALFFFTTAFEVIIFTLTFCKLFFPRRQRTQFAKRLIEDGVVYFIVVYVSAGPCICPFTEDTCLLVAFSSTSRLSASARTVCSPHVSLLL